MERFTFSRDWMRTQFQRIQDPRQPGSVLALKLNLPPYYLLIHRVWVGSIGVLWQLEADAAVPGILRSRCRGSPDPERPVPPLAVELALDRPQVLARAPSQKTRCRPFSTAVVQVSGRSSPSPAAVVPQKARRRHAAEGTPRAGGRNDRGVAPYGGAGSSVMVWSCWFRCRAGRLAPRSGTSVSERACQREPRPGGRRARLGGTVGGAGPAGVPVAGSCASPRRLDICARARSSCMSCISLLRFW